MSDYRITKTLGDDGRNIVIINGNWEPEIMNVLIDSDICELRLISIDWPDFTGLAPIAEKVNRLLMLCANANSRGLENFTGLKYFLLDEPIKPAFNLASFKSLERASLCWDKKYNADFFKLPYLTQLKLSHFDEDDCEKIGLSSSIKELSIQESRLSKLNGLQNIQSLKSLKIAHIRTLEDISALGKLNSLESLYIASCPKIASLSSIKKLKGLKRLHVEKVKVGFDNLDWVANLPNLNYVLNETDVRNINWNVVFENKSIKKFATRTHEGYTITDDELTAIASKTGRVIKVIERYPPKKNPMISVELI